MNITHLPRSAKAVQIVSVQETNLMFWAFLVFVLFLKDQYEESFATKTCTTVSSNRRETKPATCSVCESKLVPNNKAFGAQGEFKANEN